MHYCVLQSKNLYKVIWSWFLSSFLSVALNTTTKLAILNYLQGQMHNVTIYLLFDFQTLALWGYIFIVAVLTCSTTG